jgi:exocyst complex component 3
MADQFKKLNDQIQRTSQLLQDDCLNLIGSNDNILLVHYQLQLLEKFRNSTMIQARGASVEILSTLSNSFKKVDVLEQDFDQYIWDLTSKILDLLKTGHGSTIVRLVRIIEIEERLDESFATLDIELADDEAVKSVELEFTRGRKIKSYRVKFFDVIRESIVNNIKKLTEQFLDDVEGLLAAADTLIDDLVLIHDDLVPLVPHSYNILKFYVLETHRALYEMLENIISDGTIGPGSILLLLKWVREYYYSMNSRLDVSEELLEPRLLGGREEELVNGYISLVRSKLSEWLSNILNNETVHFLSRSGPPEVDGNGQYLLAGSVIVFKMFNQQIDVAITSSRGQLLYDVVLVCIDVLEEYQNAWIKLLDMEHQKFIDKSNELSDGLPEYVMALANDAMRSTEFSENIRDRLLGLAQDSFKDPLSNKIKGLLDGFMKVAKKSYQILIEIVLADTKPAFNFLNTSPQWYDQEIMKFVIGTFEDYEEDFKKHLNEYLYNKLMVLLLGLVSSIDKLM